HPDRPVSHFETRQMKARYVANKKAINPADVIDLLLQGHLAEDGVDALFYVCRRRRLGERRAEQKDNGGEACQSFVNRFSHFCVARLKPRPPRRQGRTAWAEQFTF